MTDEPMPPDVMFVLIVRDGEDDMLQADVWTREGMHGAKLVAKLRTIADGFESGDAERIA